MGSAVLFVILNFAPVSHADPSALCTHTRVYAAGEPAKTCTLSDPTGQLRTLKEFAAGAAGEKEFLTLVKAKALSRMRALAVSLRENPPSVDFIKHGNKLNRFWLGMKGAILQTPETIDRPENLKPRIAFQGEKLTAEEQSSISSIYEKQFEAAKPDWEKTRAEFLNKDTRLESTVLNARYLPLLKRSAQDVQVRLHKTAEEEQQKLVSKQPLLNYLHAPEPTQDDLNVARQFYSADLESEITKLAALDPASEAANALALFSPAVDAVLKDHPEYCEAHSSLLAKVKSVLMKRAVGTTAAAVAGGGACALAALVSDGVLALPCIFVAAVAETAVSAGAASDAYKEANVLYSGYLGRQVSASASEERRAEAQGYLLQAGLSAAGAAAAVPATLASARNIPGVMAADAAAAPKAVPQMQAKFREDYLAGFSVDVNPAAVNRLGFDKLSLNAKVIEHIGVRHEFDTNRQKQVADLISLAEKSPDAALKELDNSSAIARLFHQENVTTLLEDGDTMRQFLIASAKNGSLARSAKINAEGFARFTSETEVTLVTKDASGRPVAVKSKMIGEIVICAQKECVSRGRTFTKKQGEVLTAYMKCGHGLHQLPSYGYFRRTLGIENNEERAAALAQLSQSINQVRTCP